MFGSSTITVLGESGQLNSNYPCDTEIISFEFDVAGKTVEFHIDVSAKQATLADIVPLARKLFTKLAILFLERHRGNGQSIPCCKGCSACCSYLIPMSVPEVFRLREELLAMPTDYSSRILRSCLDTAEIILKKGAGRLNINELTKNGLSQKEQLSNWYAGLKIPCPFLSDGLCSLYEQRPLACREHIVTGSSFFCQPDHRDEPNVVPMPVSVLDALGQLTAELENLDIEAVMLPLAFAWTEDNLHRAEHTWPAVTMIKRFAEILKATAVKNSAMLAVVK